VSLFDVSEELSNSGAIIETSGRQATVAICISGALDILTGDPELV